MNLYFLVEGGKTEMILYPKWISYLFPFLKQVSIPSKAVENHYYIASGFGFESIFSQNHLKNAILEIEDFGVYNYLIVCVDGDKEGSEKKKEYVTNYLINNNLQLVNCQLEIIVQNPCIETWLMGNQEVYPTKILNKGFETYQQHYNVATNDPELMDKPESYPLSKAIYHFNYLTAMLNPKMKYSKANPPKGILGEQYFSQMQKRIETTPTHLPSFQAFLHFCNKIGKEIRN